MSHSHGPARRPSRCQQLRRPFHKFRAWLGFKRHSSSTEPEAPPVLMDNHTPLPIMTEPNPVEPEQVSTTVAFTPSPPIYSSQNMETFETIQNGEPLGSTRPFIPTSRLQNLPIAVLTRILQYLLVSDQPLILQNDSETPNDYRTHLHPEALTSCRLLYHIGMPILYGSNTITASSPATSKHFDKQLLQLPGKLRQLIKHIKLEIDWADQMWENLPLIARVLGEIAGLKNVEIVITVPVQRTGAMADMMLKIEKKILVDMVTDLRGLRRLRLAGFQDRRFADNLEAWVARGRTGPARL